MMPRLFHFRAKDAKAKEEGGGDKFVFCSLVGDEQVGKTTLVQSFRQGLFRQQHTTTVFENEPVPVEVGGEHFTISLFDTSGLTNHESLRAFTYEKSEVLVVCFSLNDPQSFYNVLHCWLPEIQRHSQRRLPLILVGTQKDLREPEHPLRESNDLRHTAAVFPPQPHSPKSPPPTPPHLQQKMSESSRRFEQGLHSQRSPGTSPCSSQTFFGDDAQTQEGLRWYEWGRSKHPKSPSSTMKESRFLGEDFAPFGTCTDQVSQAEGQYLAKVIGADCYVECSAKTREGVEEVFRHVVFSALKYRAKRRKIFKRVKEDVFTNVALSLSSCGLPRVFRFAKDSSC